MRNLFLSACTRTRISHTVNAIAWDLDEKVLFIASVDSDPASGTLVINIHSSSHSNDTHQIESISRIETFPSPSNDIPQIVSFKFVPESQRLILITRNGDITSIDPSSPGDLQSTDVEGTVEPGITAAQWSPDETLLVLTTAQDKMILMTSTFDVLSEAGLYPSEFGEDSPINVGWGSKQTQFHGSLGKSAAQAPVTTNVGSSPDDDGLPRISWRGDGSFYVVSTLSSPGGSRPHRLLRVYDNHGKLQSTSEDIAGLEHPLSWRPSGNLIATTQRFGFEGGGLGKEGRHDVVFFERNGLRHGEFSLPVNSMGVGNPSTMKWGYKVNELTWSPDSDVLAVWISFEDFDIVQLWSTGNYHWYLKHDLKGPLNAPRFTSMSWHPENHLHLIVTSKDSVIERRYNWDTVASPTLPPSDTGTVGVIDGGNILLTPFRYQNVPPPMASYSLSIQTTTPRIPVHLSLSWDTDILACLWEDGSLQLWKLNTKTGPGRGSVFKPSQLITGSTAGNGTQEVLWRQVCFGRREANDDNAPYQLALLGCSTQGADVLFKVQCGINLEFGKAYTLPTSNGRLLLAGGSLLWQSSKGVILSLDSLKEEEDKSPDSIAQFPQFCWLARQECLVNDVVIMFGLAYSGKLYVTKEGVGSRVISPNTTSMTVAAGFLIFTTLAHEVLFAPILELDGSLECSDDEFSSLVAKWERRRVERGSRIVVAVPSTMSLVLQMPRGNLETINPRPLVLAAVRGNLDSGHYRKAFSACRKHRVDLNLLVDYNRVQFLRDVSDFVNELDDVEDLNLFLTSVGRGSSSPADITEVCDAVRGAMSGKSIVKFVNSILTAYVMKSPPDHEAGLSLLLQLRDDHPSIVEDAVKYIIFLVDANSLYNTALGMYDFSLVLMIAQHSQKDPREYLPFLRELRALGTYRQRFKIDDMLKRYSRALRNLSLIEGDIFEEALHYVEQHQLYEEALRIWHGTDKYRAVLDLYGDWFFERREYPQASAAYLEANSLQKAMIAREKALDWEDVFEIASRIEVSQSEVRDIAYRISESLTSKKRYADAARVVQEYAEDTPYAIQVLVQGALFSEARRLITRHSLHDLVETHVYPGLLESQGQYTDEIFEMREQLRKQAHRIQELRVRQKEDPESFYGVEDTALHNVDVMTDASMPLTAFTRYTAAPSATSRTSKRTSKSKRKLERKAGSGRKGTVDEEEYLLKSITKLVTRFEGLRSDISQLLPHLLQAHAEQREAGKDLQVLLESFEIELKDKIEESWKKVDVKEKETAWMDRLTEPQKNPREVVPIPSLPELKWQIPMFSFPPP